MSADTELRPTGRKLDATRAAVVVIAREIRELVKRIARLERLLAARPDRKA
jgi:hypothetical protein